MTGSRRNDALAALSLANLSLVGTWNALANYTPAQGFFLTRAPGRAVYFAAMANVFLVGAALFAAIRFSRWLGQRYGSRGFAWGSIPVLFLAALPAVKALIRLPVASSSHDPRLAAGAVAALMLGSALTNPRRALRLGYALLLVLAPLIPLEAAVSLIRGRPDDAAFRTPPLRARLDGHRLPRVVWIVFDELDFRLAFPERPLGLEMPSFDGLRRQALFASQAFSPARMTLQSIPSLLTGRVLRSVEPQGPSLALLDGVPASAAPTVFSSVTALQGNSSAHGWYLPYCRLFARDLSECSWDGNENLLSVTQGNFTSSLLNQQQSLAEYGYLSPFPRSLPARHRVDMLRQLEADAVRDAADPALNLVFLHLPVPHAPHFYDSASRTFSRRNSGAGGYRDSLALADVILEAIRAAMTAAGQWDSSTVLVTSDHPNRSSRAFDGKEDPRIPFLLKLAGQQAGIEYGAHLQTVASKALVEAILRREIASPDDAARWLASHAQ